MEPLVGVIVPCFNQGRFAAECIGSLSVQTWRNWKAVVVDDASTDDSLEHLRRLESDRVSIVSVNRNLGRALVRNEAVRRLGTVDYVLNVDCDDYLDAACIEKLVAALESDRDAGLAYSTLWFFGEPHETGEACWPSRAFDFGRRYLENVIPGPGVLFRAEALGQTCGWRAEFTHSSGEDWDIWLQVVERGWRAVWVPDAVYHYRQHPDSFLARRSEMREAEIAVNLLRFHGRSIRTSCGLAAFLSPHVIPALLSSVRRGRLRQAMQIAAPLLRHAPAATATLVASHYLRRFRAMLQR